MQGLDLARAYFDTYGRDLLEGPLAPYRSAVAAGLVGEGSECFGFDDELSQDHDFGPGFCLWIPDALYREFGATFQAAYDALPKSFMGYQRMSSPYGGGRVGVLSLERFYERYTGLTHPPMDNLEWFRIPEDFLATATNGSVFMDEPGFFTAWRRHLLGFYPEDVLRKKLAARCAVMARAGQYNYGRAVKRGDTMAAYLACSEFVRAGFAAVYLLNEVYMPYDKWVYRASSSLSVLKRATAKLRLMVTLTDTIENAAVKEALIESICVEVAEVLRHFGLTSENDSFLQLQAEALMRGIKDERLKRLHILQDR